MDRERLVSLLRTLEILFKERKSLTSQIKWMRPKICSQKYLPKKDP